MSLHLKLIIAMTLSNASLANLEQKSQELISNLGDLKQQRDHVQSSIKTYEYFQNNQLETSISEEDFHTDLDNLVHFNDEIQKEEHDLTNLADTTNKLTPNTVPKDRFRLIKLQNKQKFAIGTFEEIDSTGKTLIYFERQRLCASCGAHAVDHLLQKPYFLFDNGGQLLKNRSLQLQMPVELLAEGINNNYGIEFLEWVMGEQGYFGEKIKEAGDLQINLPSFVANGFLVRTGNLDGGHWFALRKIGQEWYNLNSLVGYGTWPHRMDEQTVYKLIMKLTQGKYHVIIAYPNLPEYQFDRNDGLQIQKVFTWGNEYNKTLMLAEDFPNENHIDAVWKK